MKRFLILLVAIAVAAPAFSFDPTRRTGAIRLTVVAAPIFNGGDYEDRIASRVRRQLVDELRERGFDALDGRVTLEELDHRGRLDSDFYVEIAPSGSYATPAGSVGVRAPNVTVDVAVVVSRIAAELRVYDRTLTEIARRHLNREDTTVVPTGVGVGTYRMSVWFALPFVEYVRYRTAVNSVVEDAAKEIARVVR
jgi:hypothetical protein